MKCTLCRGNKVISPLGGVSRKCTDCNGIGYIDIEPNKSLPYENKTHPQVNFTKVDTSRPIIVVKHKSKHKDV